MKTVHNTQARDYSHVIQTFWPLLKLSPYRDNSAGRVEGRCGRLHLPTKKPKQQKNKKKHHFYKAGAETVEQKQRLRRTNTKEQEQGCPASHHGHMHRVSVCITVHGHGADAHLLGRAHHTACNLSSIGDQHLVYPSNPWTRHARQFRVSLFFFPRQQQQQLS